MFSFIKKFIKKILLGYRCDQDTFIKYLRANGAKVGENVNFFCLDKCQIDVLNLHLLEIGNNVNFVSSSILTHDYAWSVIHNKYGQILGNQQAVTLGNNIFVGTGSLILGGSVIEDNVIIGAHSVVSGTCEHDSVYAGVPAKRIMSLDEYREKREKKQFLEAKNFVKKWRESHGSNPDITKMHEYFYLFSTMDNLNKAFIDKLHLNGSYEKSEEFLSTHKPMFENYEEFLKACDADN